MKMITEFRGKTRWLSNFHECSIEYMGLTFRNTEAAYQAAKTDDLELRASFQSLNGKDSKHKGALITAASGKLRKDWFDVNLPIMADLQLIKFKWPELKVKLLATDDEELIEGNNWHDNFWGQCNCGTCHLFGENHLGKILMRTRLHYASVET